MLHRSKVYAVGLLAAVFVAGIAVGAGVSAAASDREERAPRVGGVAHPHPHPGQPRPQRA